MPTLELREQPRRLITSGRDLLVDWLERDPELDDGRRREKVKAEEIINTLGPGVAVLGISGGKRFGFDTRFEPHLILSGKSGSGKTKTLMMFIANLATQGAMMIAVEPKPGDFAVPRKLGVMGSARTPAGWFNVLDYGLSVAASRQRQIDDYIDPARGRFAEKYYELPKADPPLWIFIEEAAAVIGKGSGLNPQMKNELFSKLWDLAQRGRSADVHVVFVVQLGTLISFGGDNGNGIRTSAAARIGHDRNPENLKAMFDASEPATMEVIKKVEQGSYGRVAYSYLDAVNGATVLSGQVAKLSQRKYAHILSNYSGPGPEVLDFDNA